MYIVLYDEALNPLSHPITDVNVKITEKAFDFDEIRISGKSNESINNATLFILNEDSGAYVYSGLIKNITQKNNTVELFGKDFRTIFDSDIMIDYVATPPPTTMQGLLNYIANHFESNTDVKISTIPFDIYVPIDDTALTIFGDIASQILIVNAYQYLLPFLKYYGYVLRSDFKPDEKSISFTFDKTSDNRKIKLPDFEYDLKQSEPSINKATALQQFVNFGYEWIKQENVLIWRDVEPRQDVWAQTQPTSANPGFRYVNTGLTRTIKEWMLQEWIPKETDAYTIPGSESCPIDYDTLINPDGTKTCRKVTGGYWQDTGETVWAQYEPFTYDGFQYVETGNFYIEYLWRLQENVYVWRNVSPEETQFSETEPTETDPNLRWIQTGETQAPVGSVKYYYLNKLNSIIESDQYGDISNRYYPVKNKYFFEEYLSDAQYKAILELANQRFVDNIYIDTNSPYNPIDLSSVRINDTFDIYQDSSFYKTLPVSEIELKVNDKGVKKTIKLGFKKDKFTNVVMG